MLYPDTENGASAPQEMPQNPQVPQGNGSSGNPEINPLPVGGGEQGSKLKLTKPAIAVLSLALVVGIGAGAYFLFGSGASTDLPPTLERTSSGLQGMIITDKSIKYEKSDVDAFVAAGGLECGENSAERLGYTGTFEQTALKGGVVWASSPVDTTVERIIKNQITPVEGKQVAVLIYDEGWYTYPDTSTMFVGVKEMDFDREIPAGQAFFIASNFNEDTGTKSCLNGVDGRASTASLSWGDIVTDETAGWISTSAPCGAHNAVRDRIEKMFVAGDEDAGTFKQVTFAECRDADYPSAIKWLKLTAAKEAESDERPSPDSGDANLLTTATATTDKSGAFVTFRATLERGVMVNDLDDVSFFVLLSNRTNSELITTITTNPEDDNLQTLQRESISVIPWNDKVEVEWSYGGKDGKRVEPGDYVVVAVAKDSKNNFDAAASRPFTVVKEAQSREVSSINLNLLTLDPFNPTTSSTVTGDMETTCVISGCRVTGSASVPVDYKVKVIAGHGKSAISTLEDFEALIAVVTPSPSTDTSEISTSWSNPSNSVGEDYTVYVYAETVDGSKFDIEKVEVSVPEVEEIPQNLVKINGVLTTMVDDGTYQGEMAVEITFEQAEKLSLLYMADTPENRTLIAAQKANPGATSVNTLASKAVMIQEATQLSRGEYVGGWNYVNISDSKVPAGQYLLVVVAKGTTSFAVEDEGFTVPPLTAPATAPVVTAPESIIAEPEVKVLEEGETSDLKPSTDRTLDSSILLNPAASTLKPVDTDLK